MATNDRIDVNSKLWVAYQGRLAGGVTTTMPGISQLDFDKMSPALREHMERIGGGRVTGGEGAGPARY